ncbi:serine/threonine protein kinase [Microcoleus sp. FACHB-53]|nr:serine/threonine protein kinase [Microcoleus sp. FACHB-53]
MLQTEQVVGERYQLSQQLGNNAGRQTWLATDIKASPAKPVIVKLLAFSPQMQWEEFKLFEREAQVLKSLNHPRLPKYRDYFSLDGDIGKGLCWFALVQDYIPGKSLQQLLDQGQHFTQEQVRSLAIQVLEILTYLHGLNPPVLHRDIKPSNLIWGEDEQVYLVDFGAVADPFAVEGATFTIVGTAGYAPLEQFYGKAVPASDLYALGATLIHLLTGTSPADLPQSKLRIQFCDRISLQPSFLNWIQCLTEPDLERRFSSANQALEALQTGRFLTYSEPKIRQTVGSRIRLKKSPRQLSLKIHLGKTVLQNFVDFCTKLVHALGWSLITTLPIIGLSMLLFHVSSINSRLANVVPITFCLLIGLLIWLWLKFGVVAKIKEAANNCFGKLILTIATGILLGLPSLVFAALFIYFSSDFTLAILLVSILLVFISWLKSGVLFNLLEGFIACFGHNYLYFDKKGFGIGRQLFVFRSNRRQLGHTSEIKIIRSIPHEGIFIQTTQQRYVFNQNLIKPEIEWLVEEIKTWLKQ